VALFLHDREFGLHAGPDPLEVDVDYPVPLVFTDARRLHEVGENPGVVVCEVQAPVGLDGDVDHPLD
jgi:hypothetical protein